MSDAMSIMAMLDAMDNKGGGSGGGGVQKSYVDAQDNAVRSDSLISSTTSSTPITDSADGMVQRLTIQGRSVKSKNLFGGIAWRNAMHQLTSYMELEDGGIQFDPGSNTSVLPLTLYNHFDENKNYTIFITGKAGDDRSVNIGLRYVDGSSEDFRWDASNTKTTLRYVTNKPISDIVIKYQYLITIIYPDECGIFEGDVTNYEPYGIHSVGDDGAVTVETTGKNLCNPALFEDNKYQNYSSTNHTISNGNTTWISGKQKITGGNTYKISIDGNPFIAYGVIYGANERIIYKQSEFTAQAGDESVCFNIQKIIAEFGANLQLELGSTATSYEPYKSTAAEFSTGMPLCSVNDVHDELDCEAGVVHKRCEYDSETEEVTVLETPYDIPLTDTEKSAFRSLRTYDSTTNITITDDPEFTATYLKNTDNGQAVADVQKGLQGQIDSQSFPAIWLTTVPAMHRNIFRGKNLGTEVTAAQLAAIDDGSFDDLYVGDYWTINDIVWRIADINYWLHTGDIPLEINHLLIAPDLSLYNEKMNTSGTNSGGYPGSYMYTTGLTRAKTIINEAFPGIVLSHREIFAKSTSAYEWYDSTVDLMNEVMVYGSVFFRAKYTEISQILTVDATQLALFRLNRELIMPEDEPYRSTWLRDTNGSNTYSATNREYGMVTAWDAAHEDVGVRPVFAIGKLSV